MKSFYFLIILLFALVSCEKRNCACGDDMQYVWENEKPFHESVDILLPNAVLIEGTPLSFSIFYSEKMDWQIQSAKFSKDGQIFLDVIDLSEYARNDSSIQFPHELFYDNNGNPVTGAISVDMVFNFPEISNTLKVEGSIFFYDCESIGEDFGLEECRWPSQVIGEHTVPPC